MEFSSTQRFWLEHKGQPLIGKGRYHLLKTIDETHSLKQSCEKNSLAYRTAYNHIKKIETRLGQPIVDSHRGGKSAGGEVRLTPLGQRLLAEYEKAQERYTT